MCFCTVLGANAQDEFVIAGRFKVDGGSVNGAKIIVEKDGKRVKTVEGKARFEIGLDFQAIYVISFEKEGFVTKRLRFDTHVPEDRIEYGFEYFPFTVEIFEQYDDVNMVVFNQPVGRIAYSELIDEFDYDTDYTKSIQAQVEKAMEEVEEVKERKVEQEAQNEKEVARLTKDANSSAKSGDFQAAIASLEEAQKLKKDPAIQDQIEELKKAAEDKKTQDEFNGLMDQAEQALAAGNLEEAKRLLGQANGVMGGDPKVQQQLAKIEAEEQKQAQQAQAFDSAVKAAEAALASGNTAEAIAKAEAALAIKPDPKAEEILAKANKAKAEAEAQAAAEADLQKQVDGLLADAKKASDKGNLEEAKAKLEEAKQLKADPSIDEELNRVTAAIATMEEEKRKAEEAQTQLSSLLDEAESMISSGDLEGAKVKIAAAGQLGQDDRISDLNKQIAEEEKRMSAEAEAEAEKQAKIAELISEAESALTSGDLDGAAKKISEAEAAGADKMQLDGFKDRLEVKREEVAAQEAAAEKQKKYDDLIAKGQKALDAKELGDAETAFEEAKSYSDDPKEAVDGLGEVQAIREELAALQREEEAAEAKAAEEEAAKKAAEEEAKRKAEEEAAAALAAEEEAKRKAEEEAATALAAEEEAKRKAEEEAAAALAAEEEAKRKAEEEAAAALAAEEESKRKAEEEAAAALSAEEEAKRKAEEEAAAALAAEEEAKRKAEEEAANAAMAAEEAAKREAERQAAAEALAEQVEAKRAEALTLFQANKLNPAKSAYQEVLSLAAGDEDATSMIAQIEKIQAQIAAEKEANKEAAMAITEQGGRESEQLAEIIEQEEIKAATNPQPQEVTPQVEEPRVQERPLSPSVSDPMVFQMAQGQMEQDVRPGAPVGPIVITDEKVGDEARQTRTGQMTEDDKYDGMVDRTEAQIREFQADEEMKALMAKYPERKTVETETVGNSFITWVYINNGAFITTYKKVEHNWGGVYYFVDDEPTNRRYWDHETQ